MYKWFEVKKLKRESGNKIYRKKVKDFKKHGKKISKVGYAAGF